MGSLRTMKQQRSEFEYTLYDGEYLVRAILGQLDDDDEWGSSDNYAKAIPLLTALSTPFYRKYERRVWRIIGVRCDKEGISIGREVFLKIMSISVYHLLISDDVLDRQENLFETCLSELETMMRKNRESFGYEENNESDISDSWCGDTVVFAKWLLGNKIYRESGNTLTVRQVEDILNKGLNLNEQR